MKQQEEILHLGKKIIKELSNEDDDHLSLLEKWMGYYIAELINKIEIEKEEERRKHLQQEGFESILKLWDKRNESSIKGMPLTRIKPAIDILNEFNEERSVWQLMHSADIKSWENLAVKIHDTYMDSIRICIQAAIAEDALWNGKKFGQTNMQICFLPKKKNLLIDWTTF
ncbi:hypothetical protein [Enterocloster citroniae]